ncbi:MAG: hypothetical protein JWN70_7190 [Planctomycetaceae bacterium]|nr:hypothetical protein [Planctomycetaceae bacterium]
MAFVLMQVVVAALPGYPWSTRTEPETAVRANRFQRDSGWLRTTPTLEESIVQWQVHHLLTAVPPQDVLFVGDSSCLMGVIPEVITQGTQLRAWNLATVGSLSTLGQADILDLYFAKHPSSTPKLVVCYLAPPTLARDQEEIERQGVYNGLREWLYGADAGLAANLPLTQLPAYRLRRPLYQTAAQMLGTSSPRPLVSVRRGPFPSDDEVRRTLLETRGYFAESRKNQLPAIEPATNHLQLTADSLRGIVQMFESTHARSIDLVIMMTPLPERYRKAQDDVDYRKLADTLSAAARRFPKVKIHAPLLRYFDDASFGTPHHLTKAGATRNSVDLAKIIAAIITQPTPEPEPTPASPATGGAVAGGERRIR